MSERVAFVGGSAIGRGMVEAERGITIIVDDYDVPEPNFRIYQDTLERLGLKNVPYGRMGKSNMAETYIVYEMKVQEKAEELMAEAEDLAARMFYRPTRFHLDNFIDIARDVLSKE
ncbi:hypothetical protein VPHK369_0047 [Vibrio phage K369]